MILVVEDDQITQTIVAKILSKAQFELDITSDAYQAITNIRQNQYLVAVVDLVLPGPMNGINLIKQIKKYSPATQIIACSAYGSQQQSRLAARAGADLFLLKPFKPNELVAAVTKLSGGASNTISIRNKNARKDINQLRPLLFNQFPEVVVEDIMKLGKLTQLGFKEMHVINFTEEIAIVLEGSCRCLFSNRDLGVLKAFESIGQEFIAEGFDPDSTLNIQALMPTELFVIRSVELVKFLHSQQSDLLQKLKNNIRFMHTKSLFTLALKSNASAATGADAVNFDDTSLLGL